MQLLSDVKRTFFLMVGLPALLVFIAFLWFIPWVFVFPIGVLAYFPYAPDGISRSIRITGPVPGIFSEMAWVSKSNIPEACKNALVASEDTRFFEHDGVDWNSLQESYKYNKKRKKIKRGGSTITQQIIKNAFLSRDKSYLRKARELVGALMLDSYMPKTTQLVWYFNIVEFGANVYGLNNAAQTYFKVNASKLTASQCIALVSILPSPNKWGKSLRKKSMSTFLQARYRTILSRVILMGLTSNSTITYAKTRSPFGSQPLPLAALPIIKTTTQVGADAAEAFHDVSDEAVFEHRELEDGTSEANPTKTPNPEETIISQEQLPLKISESDTTKSDLATQPDLLQTQNPTPDPQPSEEPNQFRE